MEYRGAEIRGVESNGGQDTRLAYHAHGLVRHVLRHRWRPLAGGLCAGVLAGASAAEITVPGVGRWAEEHPVFTGALTGAALLGITVLVIDALMRLLASRSWRGTLNDTCSAAVRGGRRGADELRKYLAGDDVRRLKPGTEESKEAHMLARNLWVDLGDRVGRASLAAFASDEPDLGEAMHQLSTAADTLQRALQRYADNEPSKTRKRRYEATDIQRMWRDYVWWLVHVDELGCEIDYRSPLTVEQRNWLKEEIVRHEPSTIR